MEVHDYALQMQEEMIHDIETRRPDYVVFVNDDLSWLARENSERKIYKWWDAYWGDHYEVDQSISILEETDDSGQSTPKAGKFLLVLKRKA